MAQLKPDLSKFDNSWYKPGSSLKRGLWLLTSWMFFNHQLAIGSTHKRLLLRIFGAKIGSRIVIKPCVNIKYPWKLAIGDNSWIGEGVWIDNLAQVSIGSNCCLSQGCMLLTGNHNYKKVAFDLVIGDITLEDGCWIGAQSVVCPGAVCNSCSVLSVNSVVSGIMDANGIYQGNPAQKVRERTIDE